MKVMHVKPREQKKNTEVGTHFLFHREGITLLSWWYHGLTVEDSGSHFSLSFSDHLSFLTSKNALLLLTSKLILIGWQKISHCRNSLQKTSVFVASVLKNKAIAPSFCMVSQSSLQNLPGSHLLSHCLTVPAQSWCMQARNGSLTWSSQGSTVLCVLNVLLRATISNTGGIRITHWTSEVSG